MTMAPEMTTLSKEDRCDRCGAQAYVRVTLTSGGELLFCSHHTREHAKKLREIALTIHDETTTSFMIDRAFAWMVENSEERYQPGMLAVRAREFHNEVMEDLVTKVRVQLGNQLPSSFAFLVQEIARLHKGGEYIRNQLIDEGLTQLRHELLQRGITN
jgi:hypothetical protein